MGHIYTKDTKKVRELRSLIDEFSPTERKRFIARSFVRIGTDKTKENMIGKVLRGQGFSIDEISHGRHMGRKGRKIGFEF